jgi:uncharacterized protein (TIGR00661 family)
MENLKNKTIFISPLDWGLGHSSRCIPIIQKLVANNNIIIGVTPLNISFFETYFPTLQKISLPSYNIRYSKNMPVWLKLLLQSPYIKQVVKEEHRLLEKIVSENAIDVVISDNRFGLYQKGTENIFITHQINIKAPFFSSLATKINLRYINNFDKVWVPDYENKNNRLSGTLSDSDMLKIPVEYIGPQSALSLSTSNTHSEKVDFLILLSGVEPQRSILETELLTQFKSSEKKIVLVRGVEKKERIQLKNMEVVDFAFGEKLHTLIVNAETVICRSGYSTLMDLHLLNKKKIILIPTPGQTEQEYLANYWVEKFSAQRLSQEQIKNIY